MGPTSLNSTTFRNHQETPSAAIKDWAKKHSRWHMPCRILLIEGDKELAWIIEEGLKREIPYATVKFVSDPYEAMNLILDRHFDYIIADWDLPDMKAKKIVELVEKNSAIDPTLDPSWEAQKINIITFSAGESHPHRFSSSEHFRYLGHVFKKQSLHAIIQAMTNIIQPRVVFAS